MAQAWRWHWHWKVWCLSMTFVLQTYSVCVCVCVCVRERETGRGNRKLFLKEEEAWPLLWGEGGGTLLGLGNVDCTSWLRVGTGFFIFFIAIATHWWSQKSSICFRKIKIQLKMLVPWNILIRVHSVLKEKQGCLIFGHSRTVLHPFGKCCLVICMCVNYLGVEYASHPLTPPFSPACLIIVFVTCSSSFDSKPCL